MSGQRWSSCYTLLDGKRGNSNIVFGWSNRLDVAVRNFPRISIRLILRPRAAGKKEKALRVQSVITNLERLELFKMWKNKAVNTALELQKLPHTKSKEFVPNTVDAVLQYVKRYIKCPCVLRLRPGLSGEKRFFAPFFEEKSANQHCMFLLSFYEWRQTSRVALWNVSARIFSRRYVSFIWAIWNCQLRITDWRALDFSLLRVPLFHRTVLICCLEPVSAWH